MLVRRTLIVPLASPDGTVWHEIRRDLEAEVEPGEAVIDQLGITVALEGEDEWRTLGVEVAFAEDLDGVEARVEAVEVWPPGAQQVNPDGHIDGRPVAEVPLEEIA